LKDKGIKPCIPGRKSRGKPIKHDKRRYKRRNGIEIMFGRLKDWRRVATRCDDARRSSCPPSPSPQQSRSGYDARTSPDPKDSKNARQSMSPQTRHQWRQGKRNKRRNGQRQKHLCSEMQDCRTKADRDCGYQSQAPRLKYAFNARKAPRRACIGHLAPHFRSNEPLRQRIEDLSNANAACQQTVPEPCENPVRIMGTGA
jgi:hypothetical protein